MLVTIPKVFPINIQKINYHNTQLMQLFDSRLWDQAWLTYGPSRLHGIQIEIGS
jgi:hypothetical protein